VARPVEFRRRAVALAHAKKTPASPLDLREDRGLTPIRPTCPVSTPSGGLGLGSRTERPCCCGVTPVVVRKWPWLGRGPRRGRLWLARAGCGQESCHQPQTDGAPAPLRVPVSRRRTVSVAGWRFRGRRPGRWGTSTPRCAATSRAASSYLVGQPGHFRDPLDAGRHAGSEESQERVAEASGAAGSGPFSEPAGADVPSHAGAGANSRSSSRIGRDSPDLLPPGVSDQKPADHNPAATTSPRRRVRGLTTSTTTT